MARLSGLGGWLDDGTFSALVVEPDPVTHSTANTTQREATSMMSVYFKFPQLYFCQILFE